MRENDRISPQPGQAKPLLSLRLWVSLHPMTRAHVTLLGPCFKTGQVDSLPLHHRLLALNGTTYATAHQTNPNHCQACIHKQHDNQTRTRQQNRHARTYHKPPSPTHCTEISWSAIYTRKPNASGKPQASQRATCLPGHTTPQEPCKSGLTTAIRQQCRSW